LIAKYPKSVTAAQLGKRAMEALTSSKRQALQAQIRAHADAAHDALAAGRLAEATKAAEAALQLDPEDAAALETLELADQRAADAKALEGAGRAAAAA